MAADLRASGLDLRRACDRLIRRGVLTLQKSGAGFVVALPIFREWLGENALSKLLPAVDYSRISDPSRTSGL